MESKDLILQDAIETAIKAEREVIILSRSCFCLSLACFLLCGIIVGLLLR